MATEVELERLIVRLMGDAGSYQRTIDTSLNTTRELAAEMRRLGGTEAEFNAVSKRTASIMDAARNALGLYNFEMRRLKGLSDAGRIGKEAFNRQAEKVSATLRAATAEMVKQNLAIQQGLAVTRAMETAWEGYKRDVAELKNLLDRGTLSQEAFNRAIARARQKLAEAEGPARNWGREITNVGNAIRGVGLSLSIYLTAPLTAFAYTAGRAAVSMDSLRRGLDTVSGSAAETQYQLRNLREIAKLPGLSFQEAIEGSVALQSAGMSARMAERSLKAVGNALASVGKGRTELHMINRAFTQILGKGKIMAQEVNQIAEHLPQIRKILKEAFGPASTEAIQEMGLSAEEFMERIITEFEKLPKVTKGMRVDLENLSDAWFRMTSKVGDSIMQLMSPAIKTATGLLDDLEQGWTKLPPIVQNTAIALGVFSAVAGPVVLTLGTVVVVAGQVATAYTALSAAAATATAAKIALTAASLGAKAALAGLAIGGILAVSYAIYQSMPSIREYNAELAVSKKLSEDLATSEARRASRVLQAAKAIEGGSSRKSFLEEEVTRANTEITGLENNIASAEARAKSMEPTWVSLWQSGRKLWQVETSRIEDLRKRYDAQKGVLRELKDELSSIKVTEVGAASPEAVEAAEKHMESLRLQARTLGRTSEMAKIYKFQMDGISPAMVRAMIATQNYITAQEEQRKKADTLRTNTQNLVGNLREQIVTMGMTKDQVELWKLKNDGLHVSILRNIAAMMRWRDSMQLKQDIATFNQELSKQIATIGMNSDQIKLWELSQRGATTATLAHTRALIARKEVMEAQKGATDLVAELQKQIATFGMSTEQIKIWDLAQKGASKTTLGLASALVAQKEGLDIAKRLTEKHLTPQQKYNQSYADLQKAWRTGKLSANAFNAELKVINKELIDAQSQADIMVRFGVAGNEAVRAGTKEFSQMLANVARDQQIAKMGLPAGIPGIGGGPRMPIAGGPAAARRPVAGRTPAATAKESEKDSDKALTYLERIADGIDEIVAGDAIILRSVGEA